MTDLTQLKQLIVNNKAVLVYFSGVSCSVCEVLKPKIQNTFKKEFPNIKQIFVEASASKEITSNYGIFSVPTILIFFEGKEFYRVGKNISVYQLVSDVRRVYEMLFKDEK